MEEYISEHFVTLASCFLCGVFAGFKLKKPAKYISTAVFSEPTKLMLVVREDLKMGKGKVIAQCCHSTVTAYKEAQKVNPSLLAKWELTGQPKVVVKVRTLEELLSIKKEAEEASVLTTLIRDAGRTQLAYGTETVLAVGPDIVTKIEKLTGHLKLL